MATNKELVEQAVGAIPKWMDFLNQKEAEQNLILEQMQDEGTEFAPKTFTERLTSRFTKKEDKSEPVAPVNNRVKLEKETPIPQDSEEVVKETEVTEVTEVAEVAEVAEMAEMAEVAEEDQAYEQETVSSEDYDKQQISNQEFKDVF